MRPGQFGQDPACRRLGERLASHPVTVAAATLTKTSVPDVRPTAAGSTSSETRATVVMTAWADSRSKITARAAGPPAPSDSVPARARACLHARDTSPMMPPGSTWFRKIDR